jgi:3',5'-cyclic AMP phosphodiesterase CpdA
MPDRLRNAVLVLSDLHFGVDLLREAELPPVQLPWWKNVFADDIRRFMQKRCASHNIVILMSLPLYINKLLRQMQTEGYEKSEFDQYLLLGDLSTYASGASYNFLRQYLTDSTYWTPGFPKIPALKIPRKKLIAIPGNHDKMLRTNLDIFNIEFARRLGIPPIQPKGSYFVARGATDAEFLFILIDASIYASAETTLSLAAREHLARGEVSANLNAEIDNKLDRLRNGEMVDEAMLRNYSRALKVLLVHYAVDDRMVLGLLPKADAVALPHDCVGLDELVSRLKPDLQLVIHGHLHWPKVYNYEGVQVISATTTTQKGGKNGFFVVKFFESGDVVTEHHRWKENSFSLDDNPDLNVRILNLSNKWTMAKSSGGSED